MPWDPIEFETIVFICDVMSLAHFMLPSDTKSKGFCSQKSLWSLGKNRFLSRTGHPNSVVTKSHSHFLHSEKFFISKIPYIKLTSFSYIKKEFKDFCLSVLVQMDLLQAPVCNI